MQSLVGEAQNFTDGVEEETTITHGLKDARILVIRSQKRINVMSVKLKKKKLSLKSSVINHSLPPNSLDIFQNLFENLSGTVQALLDEAHKPERQHSCHALVFYSNFPPLCVPPANRRSGAGLGA